jgi:hypothetical protein
VALRFTTSSLLFFHQTVNNCFFNSSANIASLQLLHASKSSLFLPDADFNSTKEGCLQLGQSANKGSLLENF